MVQCPVKAMSSVYLSVRLSLNFLKIEYDEPTKKIEGGGGNLGQKKPEIRFFPFKSHWYSLKQCLATSRGKSAKKNWDPGLGPKLFFRHFLKFASLVFLYIELDSSLRQCLTSSRAETPQKIIWPRPWQIQFSVIRSRTRVLHYLFVNVR